MQGNSFTFRHRRTRDSKPAKPGAVQSSRSRQATTCKPAAAKSYQLVCAR